MGNERFVSRLPTANSRSLNARIGKLHPSQVRNILAPAGLKHQNLLIRPLNSWMAFRCFYAKIFTKLQQKDTSSHLTKLWQQDPFKAKWAIVARGYSRVRDQVGKANAPLDTFLKLVTPEIGIIGTEGYLKKMNWFIEASPDGHISLHQFSAPNIDAFEPHILHTNMTERDLISFVVTQGYISRQVANSITWSRPVPNGSILRRQHNPQESLLASRPTLPTPVTAADPSEHAPYHWTGSMSDIYHPDDEYLAVNNPFSIANAWDVEEISDPLGSEESRCGGITR